MKLKRLLPVRELTPGASLVHTQKVIHVQGKDEQLVFYRARFIWSGFECN